MTDSKDLALADQGGREITSSQAVSDTAAMLSMIRDLAMNPDIDAQKFKILSDVAMTAQDRATKQQFYADKANAILDMPVIDKRGKITIAGKNGSPDRVQGTFAKWPDLQRSIQPVLARYNLVLTHDIGHEGAIVLVTPILQHRNGYVERGEAMQLPLDTSGGKNNTQGAASAASYGKRHTSVAMLGIRLDDADDDGALLALRDEPLNDQQGRLVAVAEEKLADGIDTYRVWFRALEARARAWLVTTGRDAEWTGGAGAGVEKIEQKSPPDRASDRPEAQARPQQKPALDISTPDGWTQDLCNRCKSAPDLEALAEIERKAANALKRLEDGGLQSLYDKALDAIQEAKDRLANPGGLFDGAE